jgi:hypothetical protein
MLRSGQLMARRSVRRARCENRSLRPYRRGLSKRRRERICKRKTGP